MEIYRILFMLSVALSGCQYLGDPDQFRIENLDQSQRAEVKSAMQEWNSAIDGAQVLELNEEGGSVISVTDWDSDAEGNCRAAGPLGSDIRIKPHLANAQFRNVVLHELGHHLGCAMHESHGNVMADTADETKLQHLTDTDIACAKTLGAVVL